MGTKTRRVRSRTGPRSGRPEPPPTAAALSDADARSLADLYNSNPMWGFPSGACGRDAGESSAITMREARHLANPRGRIARVSEAGRARAEVSNEVFALSELVATGCRKFEPAAREHRVSLRREIRATPQVPLVVADPALIGRVLENLVDNALRHRPPDGKRLPAAPGASPGLNATLAASQRSVS